MNCLHSKRCRLCQICWYIRRHTKNFIIKILFLANLFSLFYWMCWVDAIISWQACVTMLINILFIGVIGYANNWFADDWEGGDN